jgi:DNA-binding protein H-NS
MTDINLDELSLKELKSLQKDVAKAIDTHGGRQKSEARAKLEELARSMGYSLAELVGVEGVKNTRAPATAKYRHPENAEIRWSGRGRRPVWFAEAIAAGKSPEDLAV